MIDKIFVDSNVFVYMASAVPAYSKRALGILDTNPIISTQVVNENVAVCLKRLKLTKAQAFEHGKRLMNNCTVAFISTSTIKNAFVISLKYQFSFWDSLIVSSALENNCTVLYSEDMQHNQIIESTLTIVNPFE